MEKKFRVKLMKSFIGCTQTQRDTVRCLGLRRPHHEVIVADNPANRGQMMKVQHLLSIVIDRN